VLAFIAGVVNVVGLLGFEHQAITHLTGNTSLLAEAMATLNTAAALHFGALIAAFVAGCAASGFIIQDSRLKLGRRYGLALLLVSVLLFSSVPLFQHGSAYGMYAAACACGLQNAMASTYSGAVVRTTHVSRNVHGPGYLPWARLATHAGGHAPPAALPAGDFRGLPVAAWPARWPSTDSAISRSSFRPP
jgi:uncharacterized membrane protein YoaK (UPF0700 family)